jgi:hypothetical protein
VQKIQLKIGPTPNRRPRAIIENKASQVQMSLFSRGRGRFAAIQLIPSCGAAASAVDVDTCEVASVVMVGVAPAFLGLCPVPHWERPHWQRLRIVTAPRSSLSTSSLVSPRQLISNLARYSRSVRASNLAFVKWPVKLASLQLDSQRDDKPRPRQSSTSLPLCCCQMLYEHAGRRVLGTLDWTCPLRNGECAYINPYIWFVTSLNATVTLHR